MERVRYIKHVDTGNPLRTYVDGQTIDIILPKNKIDLASFKLYYDVEIDPVYKYAVMAPIDAYVPSVPNLIPDDRSGATINNPETFAVMFDPNHRDSVLASLIPFQDVPGVDIPHISPNIMTRGSTLPPQPAHTDPLTGDPVTDPDTRDPIFHPALPHIDPDTMTQLIIDGVPQFLPAEPELDEDGFTVIGEDGFAVFLPAEPIMDPDSGTPFLNTDGSPVMLPAEPDIDPATGLQRTDPTTGTITLLPAVTPIIEIMDEHGKPIPTTMNPTPNILMMIDPAFVHPPPPLIPATDKFGKNIPNEPPFVVMMNDPAFTPDVPPVPLPIPRPAGTSETFLKRFMPRLSSSIIDTLTIKRNGTVVQEIKDYNIIFNILNDGLKEEDDLDGDKIDTLNYTKIGKDNKPIKVCDFANTTAPEAISPLTYRYFISNFLGLIGEGSSSLIDAGKNEIMISIKLAPKYITYRGIDIHDIDHTVIRNIADRSHEIDYQYKISNVFGNIDVLPQATNVPTVINFKHYNTVKATHTITKDTQLNYKHKGKLDYILSTFVVGGNHDTGLQLQQCNKDASIFGVPFKKNYGDLRAFVRTPVTSQHVSSKMIKDLTTENNLDNSLYFARQAINVRSSQYTLNGQALTPRMDMSQMYAQAKEFFNNKMDRVRSLSSFESEFFVFPAVISQDDDNYVSEIEWKCFEGNNREYALSYENKGKVYPIMFLCCYKNVQM